MSPRLTQVKPQEMIRALERLGFVVRKQTGGHVILRHPETARLASVPIHSGDLKRGLLFGILKQAGVSQSDFEQHL